MVDPRAKLTWRAISPRWSLHRFSNSTHWEGSPMLVIIDNKIAVSLKDVVMVSETQDVTLGNGDRPLQTHVHLAGGHKFVLEGDVGKEFSRHFIEFQHSV